MGRVVDNLIILVDEGTLVEPALDMGKHSSVIRGLGILLFIALFPLSYRP